MKVFSNYLGFISLIILFGYIIFNESRHHTSPSVISDEEIGPLQYQIDDRPLPAISFDIPKDLTFAGERVPIELPDVRERLDKELQSNTYFHSNTIFL